MLKLPPTTKRVKLNTIELLNNKISEDKKKRLKHFSIRNIDKIEKRIDQLDKEWDTERTLETSFATIFLLSTMLGFTRDKKWFALGGITSLFFLQHALQGWCPPLPIIRLLGVRAADEIAEEKYVLKMLKGDYADYIPER